MNQLKCVIATTAFLLSIPSLNVYGQNESNQLDASVVDIATLDCRELLKLNDNDKEATLAYYHGYLSGKNNELTVDVVELGEISDRVIDYCIDNPNDPLLTVFEQNQNNKAKQ